MRRCGGMIVFALTTVAPVVGLSLSAHAESLHCAGEIGFLEGKSKAGRTWAASWCDLAAPRDFEANTKITVSLQPIGGVTDPCKVLIRLLPDGSPLGSPAGVIWTPLTVHGDTVEITLTKKYEHIAQVSVQSGEEAFRAMIGAGNGMVAITEVDISR